MKHFSYLSLFLSGIIIAITLFFSGINFSFFSFLNNQDNLIISEGTTLTTLANDSDTGISIDNSDSNLGVFFYAYDDDNISSFDENYQQADTYNNYLTDTTICTRINEVTGGSKNITTTYKSSEHGVCTFTISKPDSLESLNETLISKLAYDESNTESSVTIPFLLDKNSTLCFVYVGNDEATQSYTRTTSKINSDTLNAFNYKTKANTNIQKATVHNIINIGSKTLENINSCDTTISTQSRSDLYRQYLYILGYPQLEYYTETTDTTPTSSYALNLDAGATGSYDTPINPWIAYKLGWVKEDDFINNYIRITSSQDDYEIEKNKYYYMQNTNFSGILMFYYFNSGIVVCRVELNIDETTQKFKNASDSFAPVFYYQTADQALDTLTIEEINARKNANCLNAILTEINSSVGNGELTSTLKNQPYTAQLYLTQTPELKNTRVKIILKQNNDEGVHVQILAVSKDLITPLPVTSTNLSSKIGTWSYDLIATLYTVYLKYEENHNNKTSLEIGNKSYNISVLYLSSYNRIGYLDNDYQNVINSYGKTSNNSAFADFNTYFDSSESNTIRGFRYKILAYNITTTSNCFSTLLNLDLSNCRDITSLEFLTEIDFRGLQGLSLDGTDLDINGDTSKSLSNLKNLESLTCLELNSCNIGDTEINNLNNIIANLSNLKKLSLMNNHIGDEVVLNSTTYTNVFLDVLKKFENLEYLNLSFNKIPSNLINNEKWFNNENFDYTMQCLPSKYFNTKESFYSTRIGLEFPASYSLSKNTYFENSADYENIIYYYKNFDSSSAATSSTSLTKYSSANKFSLAHGKYKISNKDNVISYVSILSQSKTVVNSCYSKNFPAVTFVYFNLETEDESISQTPALAIYQPNTLNSTTLKYDALYFKHTDENLNKYETVDGSKVIPYEYSQTVENYEASEQSLFYGMVANNGTIQSNNSTFKITKQIESKNGELEDVEKWSKSYIDLTDPGVYTITYTLKFTPEAINTYFEGESNDVNYVTVKRTLKVYASTMYYFKGSIYYTDKNGEEQLYTGNGIYDPENKDKCTHSYTANGNTYTYCYGITEKSTVDSWYTDNKNNIIENELLYRALYTAASSNNAEDSGLNSLDIGAWEFGPHISGYGTENQILSLTYTLFSTSFIFGTNTTGTSTTTLPMDMPTMFLPQTTLSEKSIKNLNLSSNINSMIAEITDEKNTKYQCTDYTLGTYGDISSGYTYRDITFPDILEVFTSNKFDFSTIEVLNLNELSLTEPKQKNLINTIYDSCPKLKQLHLAYNSVNSLEGIDKFEDLEYLDVSYNQISDASPLKALIDPTTLQKKEVKTQMLKLVNLNFNQISIKGNYRVNEKSTFTENTGNSHNTFLISTYEYKEDDYRLFSPASICIVMFQRMSDYDQYLNSSKWEFYYTSALENASADTGNKYHYIVKLEGTSLATVTLDTLKTWSESGNYTNFSTNANYYKIAITKPTEATYLINSNSTFKFPFVGIQYHDNVYHYTITQASLKTLENSNLKNYLPTYALGESSITKKNSLGKKITNDTDLATQIEYSMLSTEYDTFKENLEKDGKSIDEINSSIINLTTCSISKWDTKSVLALTTNERACIVIKKDTTSSTAKDNEFYQWSFTVMTYKANPEISYDTDPLTEKRTHVDTCTLILRINIIPNTIIYLSDNSLHNKLCEIAGKKQINGSYDEVPLYAYDLYNKTELDLSSSNITTFDTKSGQSIGFESLMLTNVVKINISHNKIDDSEKNSLYSFFSNTSIFTKDLAKTKVTSVDLSFNNLTKLTTINSSVQNRAITLNLFANKIDISIVDNINLLDSQSFKNQSCKILLGIQGINKSIEKLVSFTNEIDSGKQENSNAKFYVLEGNLKLDNNALSANGATIERYTSTGIIDDDDTTTTCLYSIYYYKDVYYQGKNYFDVNYNTTANGFELKYSVRIYHQKVYLNEELIDEETKECTLVVDFFSDKEDKEAYDKYVQEILDKDIFVYENCSKEDFSVDNSSISRSYTSEATFGVTKLTGDDPFQQKYVLTHDGGLKHTEDYSGEISPNFIKLIYVKDLTAPEIKMNKKDSSDYFIFSLENQPSNYYYMADRIDSDLEYVDAYDNYYDIIPKVTVVIYKDGELLSTTPSDTLWDSQNEYLTITKPFIPGHYEIHYIATDSSNNRSATFTRTIDIFYQPYSLIKLSDPTSMFTSGNVEMSITVYKRQNDEGSSYSYQNPDPTFYWYVDGEYVKSTKMTPDLSSATLFVSETELHIEGAGTHQIEVYIDMKKETYQKFVAKNPDYTGTNYSSIGGNSDTGSSESGGSGSGNSGGSDSGSSTSGGSSSKTTSDLENNLKTSEVFILLDKNITIYVIISAVAIILLIILICVIIHIKNKRKNLKRNAFDVSILKK